MIYETSTLTFYLCFLLTKADIIDYCDPKMCPYQGTHIRCNNDGRFSKQCTGEYFLEDMEPYIMQILDEHNAYRNIVAGGDLPGFSAATRMNSLIWDWDLAENAEYNAKTCKFAHDHCRSTPQLSFVGQNIFYSRSKNLNTTTAEYIDLAIMLWFEEFMVANADLIKSFQKTDPQTGHFTVLVNDRQDRVGCAFLNNLQNTNPPKHMVIFVCNYPSTNLKYYPTYQAGEPGADCLQMNSDYEYLCNDKIDPNDFFWYSNA